MVRNDVFKLIDGEREYQDSVWGNSNKRERTPTEWFVYIEDYINEGKHILSREPDAIANDKAMEILRKVAAMAVCAMEETETKPRIVK